MIRIELGFRDCTKFHAKAGPLVSVVMYSRKPHKVLPRLKQCRDVARWKLSECNVQYNLKDVDVIAVMFTFPV